MADWDIDAVTDAAADEIVLHAKTPNVIETPYRIEVRCGETVCDVYEHGTRGSGDWAAWLAGSHVVGEGGRIGYTLEQALDDARTHVRKLERERLLRAQLRTALEGAP
ncbi:MAG: hypothetical protein ACRD0W_12550 [Acidimicrobiales bacterium]